MAIISKYRRLVESGKIRRDANQEEIAGKLGALSDALEQHKQQNHNIISRLFNKRETCDINGLYIYGGVGRGKSMLMDLFFESCPIIRKKRVHFHSFMLDVHKHIHMWRLRNKNKPNIQGDSVRHIAREIADEAWLLCFDEFQVSDIADAMILGRLFEHLFAAGVVVVATSNRHPDDLYKDGLQRQNFLPFIEMFKQRLDVVELTGDTDYRTQALKSLSTMYFTPLGGKADRFITETFAELTNNADLEPVTLTVQGRKLPVKRCHGDVAIFSFAELCEAELGAADYIEVSCEFGTILLADIPVMKREQRNEAKRFVTLIDELYEHKTKLICTAEASPERLYTKGDGSFEFERTISRLTEMQSEQYLKQEHVVY